MSDAAILSTESSGVAVRSNPALLGMWVFLATEVMFFGVLFTGYAVYRISYPDAFAFGSKNLHLAIGAINTAVLLTSSFTIVLALHAAEAGKQTSLERMILATMALGILFLALKGYEYFLTYEEGFVPGIHFTYTREFARPVQIFFSLYFAMTGMHALHMLIGITLLALVWRWARRGDFSPASFGWVEITALYWHFVDIIWVFLFALLYLVGSRA
jgi:cytochrome c oxidase subunit 3